MTMNKRFRMETINNLMHPFIIDITTANKKDNITSYHTYETHTEDKCLELVDLLNQLNDENTKLKQEVEKWKKKYANSETNVIYEFSSNIDEDMEILERELKGDKEKCCGHCKHFNLDGMFGIWCDIHEIPSYDKYCSDYER